MNNSSRKVPVASKKTKFALLFLCCCGLHFSSSLGYGATETRSIPSNPFSDVPFEQSMAINKWFTPNLIKKNWKWNAAYDRYRAFQKLDIKENAPFLIPKKIHFTWIGSPLPPPCKKIVDSWRKLHPTWEITVWDEEKIASLNLINKKAYDKAVNYGEKTDIARYEILYRFGGIYVDTDFLCLRPFDSICKGCTFFAGLGFGRDAFVYNGMIGASPQHPILLQCIKSIKIGPGDNNGDRIQAATGPQFLSTCFFDYIAHHPHDQRVVGFPCTILYPLPYYERASATPDLLRKKYQRPESFGFHYWHISWLVGESLEN